MISNNPKNWGKISCDFCGLRMHSKLQKKEHQMFRCKEKRSMLQRGKRFGTQLAISKHFREYDKKKRLQKEIK